MLTAISWRELSLGVFLEPPPGDVQPPCEPYVGHGFGYSMNLLTICIDLYCRSVPTLQLL